MQVGLNHQLLISAANQAVLASKGQQTAAITTLLTHPAWVGLSHQANVSAFKTHSSHMRCTTTNSSSRKKTHLGFIISHPSNSRQVSNSSRCCSISRGIAISSSNTTSRSSRHYQASQRESLLRFLPEQIPYRLAQPVSRSMQGLGWGMP